MSLKCARCGAHLGETWIFSRYTRNRYCATWDACERRYRKLKRLQAKADKP
jgi:hypothetical protein